MNMRQEADLNRFKVVIPQDLDRALGERNQPVMMFFHKPAVVNFGVPNIMRGVLIFFVGAGKRMVTNKTGMFSRFFRP